MHSEYRLNYKPDHTDSLPVEFPVLNKMRHDLVEAPDLMTFMKLDT